MYDSSDTNPGSHTIGMVILAVLSAAVVAVICAILLVQSSKENTEQKPPGKPLPGPVAVAPVNALEVQDDFVGLYLNNEAAADAKYTGKSIQFTKVYFWNCRKLPSGNFAVTFSQPRSFVGIVGTFRERYAGVLADLKPVPMAPGIYLT